jgi:hypothetical protein
MNIILQNILILIGGLFFIRYAIKQITHYWAAYYATKFVLKMRPFLDSMKTLFGEDWETQIFDKKRIRAFYTATFEKLKEMFENAPILILNVGVRYSIIYVCNKWYKLDKNQVKKLDAILMEIQSKEKEDIIASSKPNWRF